MSKIPIECSPREEVLRNQRMAELLRRYHDYEKRNPDFGEFSPAADSINHLFCYDAQPKVRIYFSPKYYASGKLRATSVLFPGDILNNKFFYTQEWYKLHQDTDGPYIFITEESY